MARFHVYRLRHGNGLALDLQSNLLSDLTTRIVAPMLLPDALPTIMRHLNPTFRIEGRVYIMATQFIGAVAASEIGDLIADFTFDSDRIIAATDFLFQGF
jgi:toxin CcdB